MKKIILATFLIVLMKTNAFAAIGCDLNDPDRDIKRFYPESTSYKTSYYSIDKTGGEKLLKEVEKKLGDEFTGIFETIDVPYTFYTIYKDKDIIGYVHGANQKSRYGGMQVFLILNKDLKIDNFYFQKLTSKASGKFRSKDFGEQFIGLSLEDFADYDVKSKVSKENSKVSKIINLAGTEDADFHNALRGTKKNLILTNLYVENSKKE